MNERTETGRASDSGATAGASDRNPAIEATRLLGKWTRAARGHVSLGARCSCGFAPSAGNVQLQDFEIQILDYLFARHGGSAADPTLAALRERAGYRAGEAGSITELLRAIATEAPGDAVELRLALLSDLNRSIESFEELHRR